ncbi:MAG: TRAM domain-containing protein [Sediminibacterium sp.]|nr:TRAM domain-containing protein [Sediminibacterium sp.]
MGRNSQNKVIVFPKDNSNLQPGSYAWVKVHQCNKATLIGTRIDQPE